MHTELQNWLQLLTVRGGSILHLQAGQPPLGRIDGTLQALAEDPLDHETMHRDLGALFGEATGAVLADVGPAGTAYAYRVNVAGVDGAVIRLLQQGPADIASLGVPEAAQSLFRTTTEGLVLLVGHAGSGRSSTLAAMLAERIAEAPIHAAWIGDPPVFKAPTGRGTLTTLAVDVDVPSVGVAIQEASRLDVDALFIDPLHEHEAADLALRVAETGRLVVATVTAHGIPEALWRLIDPLEGESRKHACFRLARVFRLALDHCLVPRADGVGRLSAFGVLHNGSPMAANLIREDKCYQLNSAAMVGKQHGMRSVSQALLPLVLDGECTETAAIAAIPEPEHLLTGLQQARSEEP